MQKQSWIEREIPGVLVVVSEKLPPFVYIIYSTAVLSFPFLSVVWCHADRQLQLGCVLCPVGWSNILTMWSI